MADGGVKIAAKNQKAYHEYFIEEKFELQEHLVE